jgi:ferrochelatase
MTEHAGYDSFLLVSFGGPEGPDDVMPFLENVLRGKNVPRERMLEVAEHYRHFGGVSPINSHNRALLQALTEEFKAAGIDLPIYWGNRNWNPLLPDTLRQMRDDGRHRALAFFTSMFSCYSGCRQYRENIAAAREQVGPDAPVVEKLRMGFNHPGFIEPMADSVRQATQRINGDTKTQVLFTAHSIPMSMAENCTYERQLREACRLVAEEAGMGNWELVFQSRSGPPQQPWLEPDVCDWIARADDEAHLNGLVIAPIGFVSDHMEVLFDLDEQAAELCQSRGIPMARAVTVGTDRRFVTMVRQLVEERLGLAQERLALGSLGPWHDVCPADCCLYTPTRPPAGGRPAATMHDPTKAPAAPISEKPGE